MYKCFTFNKKMSDQILAYVIYAGADGSFVKPIVKLLKAVDVKIFLDDIDVGPDDNWRLKITKSFNSAKAFIVIWSQYSVGSYTLQKECRKALKKQKPIVPILLDDTPLSSELGEYQYLDFSRYVLLI